MVVTQADNRIDNFLFNYGDDFSGRYFFLLRASSSLFIFLTNLPGNSRSTSVES